MKVRARGRAKVNNKVTIRDPPHHPQAEDRSGPECSSTNSGLLEAQKVSTQLVVTSGAETPHTNTQSNGPPSSQAHNTSTQCGELPGIQAQNISTQSLTPVSSGHPIITNGHRQIMADRLPQSTDNSLSVSPAHSTVCVPVQDVQYGTMDRQTSPVQLTELVSSAVSKVCCPPSDKNHNVTSMYVVSPSTAVQFPQSNGYVGEGKEGLACYSDPAGAGFATSYYYQDLGEGKTGQVHGTGQYTASPESYLPYKDSVYPPHYPFAGDVCKTYSFSTPDSGREYSSPEMTTCSSTAYTSPHTNSIPSAESPDSVAHWATVDNGNVNAAGDVCLANVSGSQAGTVAADSLSVLDKCPSGSLSSGHSAYYSDEQSLEDDSMREIEQDILKSDIHRHIYENYSQHLTIYPPDDESMDQTENLSPTPSPTRQGKSHGSKKRRRRTQTPVQRSAANLRERKRMVHLNTAFNSLKDRLPNVRNRKKLSRIQTLKAAIFYISLLSECVQSS